MAIMLYTNIKVFRAIPAWDSKYRQSEPNEDKEKSEQRIITIFRFCFRKHF